MANITENLLEIQSNGNSTYYAFELDSYSVGYDKLWTDADRNMNGDVRSSFIGVFPKISFKSTPLPKETAALLAQLLNQPYFNVKFYDTPSNTVKTAQYYAGDFSTDLLNRGWGGWYNEISCDLIPVSKQS